MSNRRTLPLLLGPLLAFAAGSAALGVGLEGPAAWTAAITALCATWWVTEPIPIPATSIIPFAAFPMVGVLDHQQVATAYGHTLILLLMGGFILSEALAGSGAHRRLAVGMVRLVGGGTRGKALGPRLVLGFMLASALCSMWISNTATVLMLLPVALAVLEGAQTDGDLGPPLLLGIAWGASIGGVGTPVGTPPNVIFMGVYKEITGAEISFLEWMRVGLPVVFVLLPLAWWILIRGMAPVRSVELPTVGGWRPAEKRVLAVFLLTAGAWIFRTAPFGGWSGLLQTPGASDSTVALIAVVACFLLPNGEGGPLLTWERAKGIPWGLLLLFGGGIAIAKAFEQSGLAASFGHFLAVDLGIGGWSTVAMIGVLALSVTFLTEVTSNTAVTTLLMPVLGAAGIGAGLDPRLLMIPAALSASCAFMLPVATAPNAIVFGTERVPAARMARDGLALNLLGAVAVTGMCWLLL